MPKTKISEFSATPGNNTDIDGINISEGCAPSGINDAIRELMAQLKDFQAGTAGDSFNGPIGTTTPAAGVFTNLSASGTFALTGDQVQISEGGTGQTTANAAFNALAPSQTSQAGKYLKTDGTNTSWDALDISTADITGTLPVANGGTGVTSSTGTGSVVLSASPTFTGTVNGAALTLSSNFTLSGGTANGVAYLNGSKVLTTGSALTFDGQTLTNTRDTPILNLNDTAAGNVALRLLSTGGLTYIQSGISGGAFASIAFTANGGGSEQMRLTSTGLGIGTSSPGAKLTIAQSSNVITQGLLLVNAAGTQNGGWYHGGSALIGREGGFDTIALAAGNVGIGTSAPGQKLEVAGNIFVNAAAGNPYVEIKTAGAGNNPYLRLTASTNYWEMLSAFSQTNKDLLIRYNGTTFLDIDNTGNLGLGVTPSAWGSTSRGFQFGTAGVIEGRVGVAVAQFGCNWFINSAGSYIYTTTAEATRYASNNGQHSWHTAPSGTAGNAISFTQAMTLDASGNLLVGTTTALTSARAVFAGGNVRVRRADPDVVLGDNGSTLGLVGTINNYDFAFFTNGTERARITGGEFLLGLTAQTNTPANGVVAQNLTGASQFLIGHSNGSGSGTYYEAYFYNSTNIGSITQNGTTGVLYNITSDYRLKNVVGAVTGAGERIDALLPVDYTWKADGAAARGFLAHEFQAVYPNSVTGTKDAVDAEGKPVYQQMQASTTEVIADLVAEIQSLRARVAQLEAK